MKHFLIVYQRSKRTTLEMKIFEDGHQLAADAERLEREIQYRANPDIEVVVIDAPSEEHLRYTHGRYFADPNETLLDLVNRMGNLIPKPG